MFDAVLAASPEVCLSEFVDLKSARLWLPGLKKARVVRSDEKGRPLEVSYEFGDVLSYALVYAYDDVHRQVRWVPSAGVRDGVSGSASFEPADGGCRFRYRIESQRGRPANHEQDVAEAFARWIQSRAR